MVKNLEQKKIHFDLHFNLQHTHHENNYNVTCYTSRLLTPVFPNFLSRSELNVANLVKVATSYDILGPVQSLSMARLF